MMSPDYKMRRELVKNATALALLLAGLASLAPAGEPAAVWTKLAGLPTDLAGREMPPGMEGTWCWVPEIKGFLLYGGYSPRFTSEGWLYDPAKNEIRLLWPDDSLRYDDKERKWRVLMPRDIVWSQDRPGPARNRGAVYCPDTKKVYLFGGHPGGRGWLGGTKLGTWELDPATLRFRRLGGVGPAGQTAGVYDSANRLIVAAPARKGEGEKAPIVTWVFSPSTGKWEERAAPTGPQPGPNPAFAYDPNTRLCVYFTEYGQTWTYDAAKNEWKEAKSATAPAVRRHAGMCYDPGRKLLVLHGGVHHTTGGGKVWAGWGTAGHAFHTKENQWFNDTWTYDAARNEWKELPAAGGPPPSASSRLAFAHDPTGGGLVIYDVATGIWALGGAYPKAAGEKPPAAVVGPEVLAAQKALAEQKPPEDPKVRQWQEKLRGMPDDSWLVPEVRKPGQGCLNFVYNPDARCLMWLGGCGGAAHSAWDDYGYNNQIVVCDFDVGCWFQRRPNHMWGPAKSEYATCRHGNGCGRGSCYDSKRKVVWTLGGVASTHYRGTHGMQTYDVASDRYSPAGPGLEGWGSNCGLVYDPTSDAVVAVSVGEGTSVYDPASGKWRKGANHPKKRTQYMNVVCDPQLGVILIVPAGNGAQAHAYDVKADKWRDLSPAGADAVKCGGMPGVAYDSRNRAIIVAEHNYEDQGYGKPPREKRIWALDLAANAWKQGKTSAPVPSMHMGSSAYDENHNVVIFGGRDRLILYRWKGGCPPDAFGKQRR